MYLLKNVITTLMATSTFSFFQLPCYVPSTQMCMRNYIPLGSINEYTYENGIQFDIKSLQSLRLSSFIVSEAYFILVIVDQNFTMNAIGMVLESV